jgi:hypothetical protein
MDLRVAEFAKESSELTHPQLFFDEGHKIFAATTKSTVRPEHSGVGKSCNAVRIEQRRCAEKVSKLPL